MMEELHEDFMARIREMSSANYKPIGWEHLRASTSAKMNGKLAVAARRARKSEVIELFGKGKSDEEIAIELGLSVDEVTSLRVSRM